MGANLSYQVYRDADRAAIQGQFKTDADQSRYESGHSYSGEIGMLHGDIEWCETVFDGQREAEEHLCDAHEKWDGPMAVSYMSPRGKFWIVGGWCSS